MKVIRQISFLLLLILSVVACSDDDESDDSLVSEKQNLKNKLKGTWRLTSVLIRGEEFRTEESCEYLLTFNDRVFSIKSYSGENCSDPNFIEGKYVFNGETLEYYYLDDPEFTYSFDGTLENVQFAEDEVVLFEEEITFIDEDTFFYEIPYDYRDSIEYNTYTYKRVI